MRNHPAHASPRRDLTPEARKVIEQRRAEAQERRDKRRGQTYIFTLRRPKPSEMAKVTA